MELQNVQSMNYLSTFMCSSFMEYNEYIRTFLMTVDGLNYLHIDLNDIKSEIKYIEVIEMLTQLHKCHAFSCLACVMISCIQISEMSTFIAASNAAQREYLVYSLVHTWNVALIMIPQTGLDFTSFLMTSSACCLKFEPELWFLVRFKLLQIISTGRAIIFKCHNNIT